ncbi:MAG: V-type ATP synthase subunit H [Methanothrix sp.]|jgi:V/A-type H+-transporting ATPase subunit G/H|nr:MAG: V-type ATP synthase subunit H [Methanothrix sp.]
MTRHEILSKIKQAEADAQASIERAQKERDKRIADATAEAMNMVKNAESEAQEYYEKRLADAEKGVQSKKQAIIDEGMKKVTAMKGGASGRVDKAVEHLLKEFMGLLHA